GAEDSPLDSVAGCGRLGGRSLTVGLLDLLEDLLHRSRIDIDGKVLDGSESGTDVVHESADSSFPSPEVHAYEHADGRPPQAQRVPHHRIELGGRDHSVLDE